MPGENIAILIAGSAINAVAIGTQTPAVTRSMSVLLPMSNMASDARSTGPKVDDIEFVMSSNNVYRPAHSPREPPSSSLPFETFERINGLTNCSQHKNEQCFSEMRNLHYRNASEHIFSLRSFPQQSKSSHTMPNHQEVLHCNND